MALSQYYDVSTPPLTFSCTRNNCQSEDNEYMLTCAKCKRPTHFLCTRLPAYQLFMFTKKEVKKVMGKKQRKYVCHVCCGDVPHEFYDNSIEKDNYDEANSITSTIRQPNESYKEAFERLQRQFIEHECKYKELLSTNQEQITSLTRTKKYLTDSLWKLCLERNERSSEGRQNQISACSQTEEELNQTKKYVSVLAHTKIKSQSYDVLHEEETPPQGALGTEVLQTGNITKVENEANTKKDTAWNQILTLEAHQGLLQKHIKALKQELGIKDNGKTKRWRSLSSMHAAPGTGAMPPGIKNDNPNIAVHFCKNADGVPLRAQSAEPPRGKEDKNAVASINEKLLKRLNPPMESPIEEASCEEEVKEALKVESPSTDVPRNSISKIPFRSPAVEDVPKNSVPVRSPAIEKVPRNSVPLFCSPAIEDVPPRNSVPLFCSPSIEDIPSNSMPFRSPAIEKVPRNSVPLFCSPAIEDVPRNPVPVRPPAIEITSPCKREVSPVVSPVRRYPSFNLIDTCSESEESMYTPSPSPRTERMKHINEEENETKPTKYTHEKEKDPKAKATNLTETKSKSEGVIPSAAIGYVPYLSTTKKISANIMDDMSSNTKEYLTSKRWSSSSVPNHSMDEISMRVSNSIRTYSPSTNMPPCHLGENRDIVQLHYKTAHLKSTINDLNARLRNYSSEINTSRSRRNSLVKNYSSEINNSRSARRSSFSSEISSSLSRRSSLVN